MTMVNKRTDWVPPSRGPELVGPCCEEAQHKHSDGIFHRIAHRIAFVRIFFCKA